MWGGEKGGDSGDQGSSTGSPYPVVVPDGQVVVVVGLDVGVGVGLDVGVGVGLDVGVGVVAVVSRPNAQRLFGGSGQTGRRSVPRAL